MKPVERSRRLSIRAGGIFVLAAFSAAMAGCDGPADREAKFMKRAEQLLAAQSFDKAMLEFRNVLQINPTNAEALFQVGVIEEQRGRLRQALATFNQVVTQKPSHLGANLRLARFYLVAGDLDEVEKRLAIVFEQSRDNPQGLALRGALFLRRGNAEEAIALATAAHKAEPGNLQAVTVLVGGYRAQKRIDEALAILEDAIKRDPKNATYFLLRISLNIERDARELVEKDFAALFALEPNEPAYRIALARVYVSWKLPASAELAIRDAIRVAPNNEALKSLLISFLRTQRDFADAEKSFKELIAGAPTDHIYNYGLASLYLQNDLTDKAQAIYESIIASEKDPRRVLVARNSLARLKLAKGDIEAARQQIEAVFKADPKNEGAGLLRGQIDFNAGNYELVVTRMRDIVRDHPKSMAAYRLLAEAYVRTNRLDLAVDTLGSALGQVPRDNRLRLRLAELYVLQERYDAAFEIANALANRSEVADQAQRIRAEIFTRTKRYEDALAAIDKLRTPRTSEAQIQSLRGQVLLRSGDFAGAVAAFEKAVELGSLTTDVVTGLVSAHVALKQYDAAEVRLKALMAKEPNQAYIHNLLGEIHVRQSRTDEARAQFEKASELSPRWPVPYLNLSNILMAAGKADDAITVLKSGIAKAPANELLTFSLGLAYQRADKVSEAITIYEGLLKSNPNLIGAANNLAILLVDYGTPDQTALDRALALVLRFKDSSNSSLLDTLGWVHYRRGEFPQAIEYLKRSVAAAPNSAEPRYHLGMAYLRSGQPQLAKAELERSVAGGATYRGIEEARTALAQLVVETAK